MEDRTASGSVAGFPREWVSRAAACATVAALVAQGVVAAENAEAKRLTPRSKVSTAGLGPVKIGMTVRQAERAGGDLRWQGSALHGCRYLRPADRRIEASFMVIDRRITRVDVSRPGIRTPSGFTVGSSERAVRRAFAGRLRITRHEYKRGGYYLEFVPRDRTDAGRRVIFETNGRSVTYIRAGRLPQVRYIEGCA